MNHVAIDAFIAEIMLPIPPPPHTHTHTVSHGLQSVVLTSFYWFHVTGNPTSVIFKRSEELKAGPSGSYCVHAHEGQSMQNRP